MLRVRGILPLEMQTSTKITMAATFIAGALAGAFAAPPAKKLAKQFLNGKVEKPPGYTLVVTSAPGKMVFLSGRGGAGADFGTQATGTFEELKRCLALAGADFKDVVKINYYVTDMSHTAELRQIRAKYLNMEHPPAATLVQAGLGGSALIEVEAIAMVPE